MIGQLGLTGWQTKEHIVDPLSRPLKPRASLLQLLQFGNQLTRNVMQKESLGGCPSANFMVEDTAFRKVACSLAILVWWRDASRIPLDK
jgi:hypothetical protein